MPLCNDGHRFHLTNYVFARDENGVPIRGGANWHKAAKYSRVFCAGCGVIAEIQVCPPTVTRVPQAVNLKEEEVTICTK